METLSRLPRPGWNHKRQGETAGGKKLPHVKERERIKHARRVVVKLGTSVCLSAGAPNGEVLLPLAREIAHLRRSHEIVLVSSGAVGLGRATAWGKAIKKLALAEKQALAAIGQVELMNMYRRIFELLGVPVAQVLLTRMDLGGRERYLNARNTLLTLLHAAVLPIINENDSVATEEIRFGDNDILACLVGSVVDADLVVNLTQTEGLLDAKGEVIPLVTELDESVYRLVSGTLSPGGTGGMASKLDAARAAFSYGGMMVIARAATPNVLERILAGEHLGTLFAPPGTRLSGRKRWLATSSVCKGRVRIDSGAVRALTEQGRSLLPVGIREVEGEFKVGDIVAILNLEGNEVGRGLSNYASAEVALIKGHPSKEIEDLLGFRGYDEVIHRDNLYISKAAGSSRA